MIAKRIAVLALVSVLSLSAIPAFAEDAASVAPTPVPTRVEQDNGMNKDNGLHKGQRKEKKEKNEKRERKVVDGVCMSKAVDVRDTAMIAAVDAYATAVKTALGTRKAALSAAWQMTDEKVRATALKDAWTAFKGTWKTAARALNTSRHATQKTFADAARVCGGHDDGESRIDNQI